MSWKMVLDILVVAALLPGVFFMTTAALGLVRFPDIYQRMHAATKGVTLGIICMLIASALALSSLPDANATDILIKVVLVIIFQFISNPVGAHLLAKAAHLDSVAKWEKTLSDELEEDRHVNTS